MDKRMNKYIGVLLILGLMSCHNSEHKGHESQDSVKKVAGTEQVIKFDDAKVQGIYDRYLDLKNFLVDTKYKEAKEASKVLSAKLGSYEGCENTALIADKITNAATIEEQRKQFTFLSSDVIAMFKHAEIKKGTIYVQHCPMANNGDGGDWLSSNKNIQNPYYGSEMMECGSVIEEIKN